MRNCRISYCCPLSPHFSNAAGASDDVPDGWDSLEDADVLIDPVAKSEVRLDDADDEVDIDSGDAVQVPRTTVAPLQPSKEEKERHDLTHINYRSWCPHCVLISTHVVGVSHCFALTAVLFEMLMTLRMLLA